MEAIRAEDFLGWAAGVGIEVAPRDPGAGRTAFALPHEHSRFWVLPNGPARWPPFIAAFLTGLDEWSSGFLWPRFGRWPEASSPGTSEVRDVVLRGAGVPGGWDGALRFDAAESDLIAAILFPYLVFGWCADDDLFFIPGHGRQVIRTDHHDVIEIRCLSEERVRAFVAHMIEEGYDLPTEPPDGTFRWPAWMGPEPPGWATVG